MKKILTILLLCWWCMWASAQSYQVGDVYTAPDGSRGIVYYLHPDGSGGWVVALTDASEGCAWGTSNDVPGLANQNLSLSQQLLNDTAGYANTQAIRSYQHNSTTYAAGKVDFAHGWVLPSPAQLSVLYGQLPLISSAITAAGGTNLSNEAYWCSAECSASYAWRVLFSYGYFIYTTKNISCRVRAVRSFSNTAVVYDTSLTYLWNTGSTQPYINVSPTQTSTYTVTGTTDYGCSTTAEQTIIVGTGSSQTIYDTICSGEGYEANGFSLMAEETSTPGLLNRTRTLETEGCNSTLTLQLTVKSSVTSTHSATACGSYTWNGVTYYESGDYTQTFIAANGCDSVVTLNLTINNPIHTATTITQCDSYTWHDVTYTSSGTYTYSHTDAYGCTQVDTLHLTINRPAHNSINVEACETYTWTSGNGQTYTISGDYTYAHPDANGCTQVDTLHLTILESPDATIIATADTICLGDSVTLSVVGETIVLPAVAIGNILCTDGSVVSPSDWPVSGKTAIGIVFYVDSTGEHGWAVHLQNHGSYQWASYGTDVSQLPNISYARVALMDLDGYTNTQILLNNAYCPAAYAVDFANGWYLPAIGQLNLLFAEMVTLNTSLQVVGGTQFYMDSEFHYWSSTECGSGWSWYLQYSGILDYCAKTYKHLVRSVRNF